MQSTSMTEYDYLSLRRNLLAGAEGAVPRPYLDTKDIPTIGIGFNLQKHDKIVLQALGLDVENRRLTGAALAAENGYIKGLLNIINGPFVSDADLRQNVDKIMVDRALDPAYAGVTHFPRIGTF